MTPLLPARIPSALRIGVIANPNSRQNRRNPQLIPELEALLGARGKLITTHSVEDLRQAAAHFLEQDVSILCLNGGDGTNQLTLSIFSEVYGDVPLPTLVFLRGGTMNTVAWDVGLRTGSPQRLLRRTLERLFQSDSPPAVVERNTLRIGDAHCFLFGNGMVANFLEEYYAGGQASPWKGFTTLMRTVGSCVTGGALAQKLFERLEAEVWVDGEQWPRGSWSCVGAGTVGHLGLGFYPFFKAQVEPGTMHVLGFAAPALRSAMQLPNFFMARQQTDPDILDACAKTLELKSPVPFYYTMDGDLHLCPGELKLEVGPSVRILVP